ncbi:MAG: hypothetical protein ABWY56_16240 [Propionibacteriaceae bacterium]
MSTAATDVPLVRRELPVPPAILARGGMVAPSYVDAFTLSGGVPRRTAEQWARTILADVAGREGQVIWRVLLALRLREAPERVAGWRVAYQADDWIRLEARSWFMTGHLVVLADAEQLCLGTFVHYDRRVAAWIWGPLSRIHRRLAPSLLRDALAIHQSKAQSATP